MIISINIDKENFKTSIETLNKKIDKLSDELDKIIVRSNQRN